MPRSPNVGVVFALIVASVPLTGSSRAQTWRERVGYNALVAELGGAPPFQYSATTFVPPADSAWHYRKGTSEASTPTDAWRFGGFTEDASWLIGQTPIGYGDGDDNTVLTDMRGGGGYTSVYMRREFTVAPGGIPARLTLRIYADDGAVVWINGLEAKRVHVGGGFLPFNTTAAIHEAEWEEFILPDASQFLVEGDNVIAVHALNQNPGSSDFSIDVELLSTALRVSQIEGTSGDKYLPQAWPETTPPSAGESYPGTSLLDGTTLFVRSVDPSLDYGGSTHSRTVGASFFYGISSLVPPPKEVDVYSAGGWLEEDRLQTDTGSPPLVETTSVQNHSWILNPEESITTSYLNEALRRIDFAIERDDFLCAVGLNNGSSTAVPPVLSTAYNVISVGRSDGEHSRGGTLSSYDGSGRTKPEIVAPREATSWTTGIVSSAATLLMAAANAGATPAHLRSQVVKAMLMAGATKDELPSWTRTPTQPIDTVYGAGELNIQNSYHILQGGKTAPAQLGGDHGWDDGSLAAGGSATYTIEVPRDIGEFSALVTWNRRIDTATWLGDASFSSTVADISLQLHRVTGATMTLCDSSDSAIDNVEHVYLRGIPAGTYTLTVASDLATEFGIAWRSEAASLPAITLAKGAGEDELSFDLTGLAVGKSYTLESSTEVAPWVPELSFVATADTETVSDPDGLAAWRRFYRLTWNPAN